MNTQVFFKILPKGSNSFALRFMSIRSVLLEEPDWPPPMVASLCITGTDNLACNVINNTVNTTVQQYTHRSMIVHASKPVYASYNQ